ncbi:bacillithiol biosynthesis cysteine-adding enzyme BshC [Brevibacillus aydinogluensis]|jgi:bacillithiol biosynthesis cysteine-adding enzyme BshC|uniref:bacillithiol biosynthesis cysteine-adding enzyme BshC n=1 Tax=Brevibacillus TaxID=55080 RepID=UPI000E39D2C9|nr:MULTISPECIES: bacillithiol biosynthesis cysteine-adding enzyme BshC [Brevibacillus]MBR8658106.1 bacillithiol biosynthesis cysteine-adding enzyme BshC [Brevibacillus sp. NL20B1]MDT3414860.1 bacillithiol biosynthesis cysteine-adding enzyme BshC [Brevibacillus aydinogluensis]REK61802.1 MAG: bacillithiol biosynthesis cysteine-adding enzyme BshC [Brevibacillus sp.]
MKIECVALPLANPLSNAYQQGKADALQFFAYHPYRSDSYRERIAWLTERPIPHRNELADGLYAYNSQIGNHPEALAQIERLRCTQTLVVVGGQQAGVLTGPLYTIYKAVHLVQAAKRLSKELQTEVVPVFWIAGEDHDIDEIDHLYWLAEGGTALRKGRLALPRKGRPSASMLPFDPDECRRFLADFFADQTETEYTAVIRDLLEETQASSKTLADWFARLMARLFGKHGLVLVESSLPFVRKLEQPMFRAILEQNEQLAGLLMDAAERIEAAGYPQQLQVKAHQANLFLYEDQDRLLLERHGERFVTRRRSYTREELLRLAEMEPERFSANVVTRPLMQEYLFPTLAFVAGPGEVAYWAYLKEVFELFGLRLPIVLPRLSVTLVEGAMERLMRECGITIEQMLRDFAGWKAEWEARRAPHPLAGRFTEVREGLLDIYRPLVDEVIRLEPGMRKLAEKNVGMLMAQVDFLEKRLLRLLDQREDVGRVRVQRLEAALAPEGAWQERKLSYVSFANKHGLDLVDRLIEAPLAHDGRHHVIYL